MNFLDFLKLTTVTTATASKHGPKGLNLRLHTEANVLHVLNLLGGRVVVADKKVLLVLLLLVGQLS